MELKDTVDDMLSESYKDRFRAEFFQAKIRYEKLDSMLTKYEAGIEYGEYPFQYLTFIPQCDYVLLKEQRDAMRQYIHAMALRAVIEKIDLSEPSK